MAHASPAAARRSISSSFADRRARGGLGLVPFVPAGYPDIEWTASLIEAVDACNPACIEVGFPFSDPIADGPTIQAAFTAALEKKLRVADVFAAVRAARPNVGAPLVAMVSYSIVFRYGLPRFLADAKGAGFDGLILPDLPPPEAQRVCDTVRAAGLETILLVAPTTTAERRREIARLSSGFVYYLSVSGITGEREKLPADLAANVASLRKLTDRPICVGFGIHKPSQVREISEIADGAIVGSAIVKRITQLHEKGRAETVAAVRAFCRELMGET